MTQHLAVKRLSRLITRARAQPFGCHIPGNVPEPMPDEVCRNDEVLSVGAAPAQDDVGMRMTRIVMVGRDSRETRAELDFGPRHHFPRVGWQVSDFIASLG
jgi:hypothetical protein